MDADSAAQEQADNLTDARFWDDYWAKFDLPLEIKKSPDLCLNEILRVFDRYLPSGPDRSILEVGGAPGQYLAYMHRQFGYACSLLDYSPLGCRMARANLAELQIPADVYQGDLFADDLDLPQFDVVFSLGLIEHFTDLTHVVERHVRLVKPGGIVVLGCPNFGGINHWFMERMRPEVLETLALETMDFARWETFERELGLIRMFADYVGGLEPSAWRVSRHTPRGRTPLGIFVAILAILMNGRFRTLRRLNSGMFSYYMLGVYRTAP